MGRTRTILTLASLLAAAAAVLLLVPAGASLALSTGQGKQEFGDAPDGRPTGYGPRGKFPSLRQSDGARAGDSSTTILGQRANREPNARLVNRDRFDDGVGVNLNSCKKSVAFVIVNRRDIKVSTNSKAYVNLFFDWNQNGRWGDTQRRCGKKKVGEWTVKNFEIDLGKQTTQYQVYRVSFRAGLVPAAMWYRVILTIDQPWQNARGAGAFASGEVEDYFFGEARPSRYRCDERTLDHGKSELFTIVKKAGSSAIVSTRLAPRTAVFKHDGLAENGKRRIERLTTPPNMTRYVFESKQVHFNAKPTGHGFTVLVTNKKGRTIRVRCRAKVLHAQIGTPGGVQVDVSHSPVFISAGVPQVWLCIAMTRKPAQNGQAEVIVTPRGGTPFPSTIVTFSRDGRAFFRTNVPVHTTAPYATYAVLVQGKGFKSTQKDITVIPGAGSPACTV